MANPYSKPINYKYKPLDIGILAKPLAQEQARYDGTMEQLDSTTFELKNLDPDSDRAKYLQKHLGDSVDRISDNLLKSGDYRASGRNLKKANKFYNSNEEIKAIQGNYSAWTKALKEQKKRVAKGDLTQKALNEWKFRQTNEFKQSGGTGFTKEGDYNNIGTQGRVASKEKEIEEWTLKLAEATPAEKETILGKIEAVSGIKFKHQVKTYLLESKDKNKITRELYNTLSTSARFAPWLEDRADYSQYFSSRNPDGSTDVEWASKKYGKNLAIYNAELKKIDDSTTLNAKDKKAKKAIIKARLNELEEGYKNAKQGGMERLYKDAFTKNYLADLSGTTADIVDYQNTTFKTKFFDDKAALKASKKADELVEGLDINFTADSTGDFSVVPGLGQLIATLNENGDFTTITDPITGVTTAAGTNLMLDAVVGTGTSVDDQGNEIPATGLTAYSENISNLDSQITSIGTAQQQLSQNKSEGAATQLKKLEAQKQTLINQKAQVASKQVQARGLITVATENAIRDQIEELEVANEDASIYKAQLKEFNKVKNGSMDIEDFLREQKELGQSIYNLDPRRASKDSGYEILSIPSGGYDKDGNPKEFEKGAQSSTEKVYDEILEADKTQKRFNQNPTIVEFTLGGTHKSTEYSFQEVKGREKQEAYYDAKGDLKYRTKRDEDGNIEYYKKTRLSRKKYPNINVNTNELKEKLDKLGYDLVEDTDRQTVSDKKTNFDNQTNRHYKAVPKNLIEDYDAYQLDNINKSNEKIARNIYDLQGDLGTNDIGVVVDEVSNELSGGELTRLTDFQKTDVQYTNTEVFERDDFGNYSMVEKASADPKSFRPNLELYVPKNIVGTNEDGTPIIRWSLAERLTPEQVNAELDKLTPGQLGVPNADGRRLSHLKTLTAEEKRDYFEDNMEGDVAKYDAWIEQFNKDVFIGSTGTSFNTTSMLENARESLGTIMQYSDPTEKMNALNDVAQLDVALDNKKQKQLRSDFVSLESGAIDSLPFKQGTPFTTLNDSGKEEVFYYELGYESSNGAIIPIINLKNTNGESIHSNKLDDIKAGQGTPEILMRKLELQYGIESPQAYILNL